jgi:hypothetical protein
MPIYQRPDEDETFDHDAEPQLEANATQEEKTWFKRYGDLRRHLSRVQNELKQVRETTAQNVQLPDPDDAQAIDNWIKSYPQVAKIVQGIANREAERATANLTSRVEELNNREHEIKQENARNKLADAHPDFFDDIRHRDDFHEWLGQQSESLQNTIYGEGYDWKGAIATVTLYKAEKGITKAKPKSTPRVEDLSHLEDVAFRLISRATCSPSRRLIA